MFGFLPYSQLVNQEMSRRAARFREKPLVMFSEMG